MARCWHCKIESPAAHYERTVYNKSALYAEWSGWRMSGRFLIAPGKAGRIMPERLLGMLWEEQARRSQVKARSVDLPFRLIPARERFDGCA